MSEQGSSAERTSADDKGFYLPWDYLEAIFLFLVVFRVAH